MLLVYKGVYVSYPMDRTHIKLLRKYIKVEIVAQQGVVVVRCSKVIQSGGHRSSSSVEKSSKKSSRKGGEKIDSFHNKNRVAAAVVVVVEIYFFLIHLFRITLPAIVNWQGKTQTCSSGASWPQRCCFSLLLLLLRSRFILLTSTQLWHCPKFLLLNSTL
jgi:hypothetical protein